MAQAAVPALLGWADEPPRRCRTCGARPLRRGGDARLAFAAGNAATALAECRRAVELLEDRESPWACIRLWALLAESPTPQGDVDEAGRAEGHLEGLATAST